MGRLHKFRFRRALDGLEYEFRLQSGDAKESVYVRSDSVVSIVYDWDLGWSAWNGSESGPSRILTGRVWEVPIKDQGDCPTEGVWVSRKGDKSYVYMLEYMG
jgi:hypothetical protein